MAKAKRKPKVDTDAEAEKARDAVDEFCTPDKMSKAEAVEFYETLIGWFRSSVEVLQEEMENER